jgi:DNA-binding IscR family transcriptional regulator
MKTFEGSAGKMLTMILTLRKLGKIQLAELATIVGATDRQIRRYMREAKAAGFPIESKSGKDGGYWLNEPYINDQDWIILKDVLSENTKLYEKIEYRLTKTI